MESILTKSKMIFKNSLSECADLMEIGIPFSRLVCSHCGEIKINERSLKFHDELFFFITSKLKKKIKITSFYRCPEHNQNIGGAKSSAHTEALAADFFCPEMSLTNVFDLACSSGIFSGVGIYSNGTVHVDQKERAKPIFWTDINGVKKYFENNVEALQYWRQNGVQHI